MCAVLEGAAAALAVDEECPAAAPIRPWEATLVGVVGGEPVRVHWCGQGHAKQLLLAIGPDTTFSASLTPIASEALADQLFKMQLSIDQDEEERATAPGVKAEGPDRESMALDPEDLDSFEISPRQNQLIVAMLDSGMALGAFFATRCFTCLKFAEPGLVLSDRPMYLYRKPEHQTPFLGVGPATADEIWLPIDRRTALILHGDEVVGDGLREAPSEFSIDQMNQALVSGTYIELYCHPDDLDRLDRLTLPNPDRPLMEMSGGWLAADSDGVNSPPRRKRPRRYRGGGEP